MAARRIVIIVSALLVAAAGVVAVIVVTKNDSQPPTKPIVYANVSQNFKACLLTTANDSVDVPTVWSAIQMATSRAPINAQHLTIPPAARQDLTPYLNSLLALHCRLIVTAGGELRDTLVAVAKLHPEQHFANVGLATGLANVHDFPDSTNGSVITDYIVAAARG
jgi:hypothetical protein